MKLRLHHVGVLVADIAASRRIYQDRFGYDVHGDIVHDPVQTAYVQFMKLPGDASFLELVAPDGPASKLADARNKGVGLHHLCYATERLDESCDYLREQGMSLIRRPVGAVAFHGRRIAWLMGRDRMLVELVEQDAGDPVV